jgi:hypothetical protein
MNAMKIVEIFICGIFSELKLTCRTRIFQQIIARLPIMTSRNSEKFDILSDSSSLDSLPLFCYYGFSSSDTQTHTRTKTSVVDFFHNPR